MSSDALTLIVAMAAGGVAAVTGFGIGSLLTPLLAMQVGTPIAVAAVSIPHAIGTALRFSLVKGSVNRKVLWSFGVTSAVGGLIGAMLQVRIASGVLTTIFGALLLFAAASEASGLARRMRFHGLVAWVAGALSGLLGGLVGNQGGIRSAALLGFDLSKQQFIATATAIALLVDGARMPVYLWTRYGQIAMLQRWLIISTLGVVIGTLAGTRLLGKIHDAGFRRVLAIVLAILGVVMIARGLTA